MRSVVHLAEARAQPIPSVVQRCEELLEMARRGEIRGVFVAYVGLERTVGTVSDLGDAGEAVLHYAMAGAAHRMLSEGWRS